VLAKRWWTRESALIATVAAFVITTVAPVNRSDAPPPVPPMLVFTAEVPPVRLHSGMTVPSRTTYVAPVYPEAARKARTQGVVIVEATIDGHGAVASARVLRSIPQLDAAALEAVRQWRFAPTLVNGQPVPVVMTLTVNFTLQDR
jgi:protein TonB